MRRASRGTTADRTSDVKCETKSKKLKNKTYPNVCRGSSAPQAEEFETLHPDDLILSYARRKTTLTPGYDAKYREFQSSPVDF